MNLYALRKAAAEAKPEEIADLVERFDVDAMKLEGNAIANREAVKLMRARHMIPESES